MNKLQYIETTLCWTFLLGSIACSSDIGHKQTVIEKIGSQSNTNIEYEQASEEYIDSVKMVLVNIDNNPSFYVARRTSEINSYPCQNCHTKSLEELGQEEKHKIKKAHWDINLIHADSTVMNCISCHNKLNMNSLSSLSGTEVSFDRSFDLCGQCHSSQKKDWIGGAHGKRQAGWVPPRISYSCVNCHNPHNPAFQSRWPARLNATKILEQENK